MAQLSFNSAGVSVQEIDLSGPVTQEPTGIPAGVIGTALKGPAFVPVTLGAIDDFFARFGDSDGTRFGPLAVSEWLRNAGSATYMRVLGAGTGEKRTSTGNTAGIVTSAGFVVGQELPDENGGLANNPFANAGTTGPDFGPLGRTYLLGCYMSETLGSTVFSDAVIQGAGSTIAGLLSSSVDAAVPIVRGILLPPSGVLLRLSSSATASAAPAAAAIAAGDDVQGSITGTVKLLEASVAKQEFVMLLNGHKGTDSNFPNVITASFDPNAQNYFSNLFNQDPLKLQDAGHLLYVHYDVPSALAVVTGTVLLNSHSGAGAGVDQPGRLSGAEESAFLTTGALGRSVGDTGTPNYENFEDRFSAPITPTIVSQKFGGATQDLFTVESLDDGEHSAQKLKVSLENLAASTDDLDLYGTFDLLVRNIDDSDNDFTSIEEFRGLSLNPASDRYISKIIGDQRVSFDFDKAASSQKLVLEGSFPNRSNHIRVNINSKVDNKETDPTALPFGFRGHPHLVSSGSAPLTDATSATTIGSVSEGTDADNRNAIASLLKHAIQPPVPLRRNLSDGEPPKNNLNANLFWGVKFQTSINVNDLNQGKLFDSTITNLARWLPDMMTAVQNVVVSENAGTADTAANGVLDADRFNNNAFSLENVRVTTGSDARADTKTAVDWIYVRAGGIVADPAAKTRGMNLEDLKKQSIRTFAKYSLFLQGGFDGVNIFDEDTLNLTDNAVREEIANTDRGENNGPTIKSYTKAIDILKNKSDVDIQLLAIPGIRQPEVTDVAISAVEDRFDAMYIMDIEERDEINAVVTSSVDQIINVGNTTTNMIDRNLDSNFAAAYFPDVIMTDPVTTLSTRVPPSVVVLGAFALNDAIGFPWFAPAGFSRGALATTEETAVKLNRENLDELYAADINPLVAFQNSDGVVVWGQKTLQQAQTALDRVNVRRLLIEIRRQTREVADAILFEPNRAATLSRFQQAVRPRLEAIQARQGVVRFRVIIDTTTTTQADVENNTIRGKIFVEPTRTAEFVSLDFVVTNQGAGI